jgi:hypothetical protein
MNLHRLTIVINDIYYLLLFIIKQTPLTTLIFHLFSINDYCFIPDHVVKVTPRPVPCKDCIEWNKKQCLDKKVGMGVW